MRRIFWFLLIGVLVWEATRTHDFIFYALLGLLVFVFSLRYFARKNPEAKWVQVLCRFRGVRTDTKYMTKDELYFSGFQFLKWSIIFLIVFLISMNLLMSHSNIPLGIMAFVTLMSFLISFFGGLYLLVRGTLREKNYIPPAYEDEGK